MLDIGKKLFRFTSLYPTICNTRVRRIGFDIVPSSSVEATNVAGQRVE